MGTACYNRTYLQRQAVAVAAEVVVLQELPREQCVLSHGPSPGPSQVQRRGSARSSWILPRCCGSLGENWLAFTLEFCIISGSKFELLLAPLVFQALQKPAMGTEEWRELQRPGMEGQQHPGRPGGDRRPVPPTPRRGLRSGDLPEETMPLSGPWAESEAPSLGA